jgi:hypothetical protein
MTFFSRNNIDVHWTSKNILVATKKCVHMGVAIIKLLALSFIYPMKISQRSYKIMLLWFVKSFCLSKDGLPAERALLVTAAATEDVHWGVQYVQLYRPVYIDSTWICYSVHHNSNFSFTVHYYCFYIPRTALLGHSTPDLQMVIMMVFHVVIIVRSILLSSQ